MFRSTLGKSSTGGRGRGSFGGGRGRGSFGSGRGGRGKGGRGNYNFGKKRGGWSSNGGRGKKRSYPSSGSPAGSGSSLSTAAPPPPTASSSSSSSAGFGKSIFGKAPANKKPNLGLMTLSKSRPGTVSKKPLL